MPELPEVEVVRRGLAGHVLNRRIARVDVAHPRSVRRHVAGGTDFAARLTGHTLTAACRRGKYLWLDLDGGAEQSDAVLAHLGMSGQMLVADATRPDEKHLRIRLVFDDDGPELRFVDQRTFGGLSLHPLVPAESDGRLPAAVRSQLAGARGDAPAPSTSGGGGLLPAPIAHIARDPMDPAFSLDDAVAAIRRRRTELKRALLDQTAVSGIGNIYADEALWRAKLHYARGADTLRRAEAERLFDAVDEVFAAALRAGGTSFDSLYVSVNGESGYFDRSLEVYGREGEPCSRCGAAIRREPFMNRSSYRCPRCQRTPRDPRL